MQVTAQQSSNKAHAADRFERQELYEIQLFVRKDWLSRKEQPVPSLEKIKNTSRSLEQFSDP